MNLYAINPVRYINLDMVTTIYKIDEDEWEVSLVDGTICLLSNSEVQHILELQNNK